MKKKIKKDYLELEAESEAFTEAVEVGSRIFINLL